MHAIVTAPLVPPRQRVPELPPSLEAIVLGTLDRAPEKRYGSMRALGTELLAFPAPAYAKTGAESSGPRSREQRTRGRGRARRSVARRGHHAVRRASLGGSAPPPRPTRRDRLGGTSGRRCRTDEGPRRRPPNVTRRIGDRDRIHGARCSGPARGRARARRRAIVVQHSSARRRACRGPCRRVGSASRPRGAREHFRHPEASRGDPRVTDRGPT